MRLLLAILFSLLILAAAACSSRPVSSLGQDRQKPLVVNALPTDGIQPWEQLDGSGYVVPSGTSRSTSAFGQDSQFIPGVERFGEIGQVTDHGETSVVVAGSNSLSGGIYRVSQAGVQPAAVAIDANLQLVNGKQSQYWVGLSDYGRGVWDWRGPFSEAQVTFTLDMGADYLSPLGNTFVAVAAFDESQFDIVGITVSPRNLSDTTAPPAPAAPTASAVDGGVELAWLDVIAGDLAGYRIYWSYSPFNAATDNGVQPLPWLENTARTVLPVKLQRNVYFALSAVDVNGNESDLSPVQMVAKTSGVRMLHVINVSTPSASVKRGDQLQLTATGADEYQFDTDGDGVFDVTGNTTGSATIDTSATGIIRPRVRAHSNDGKAVAFGSVSLIVSGNQRPVASAAVSPAFGNAPLDVDLSGSGEDFDGTITEYAWDLDGDGIFDSTAQDIAHIFTIPGLYNLKLRVTDDQGAWDVDTVSVQALESALHIEALPSYAQPGQPIELMVHANAPVTKYEWDMDGDGVFERDAGISDETTVSYNTAGPQSPTVRVTFAGGQTAISLVCVLVSGFASVGNLDAADSPSTDNYLSMATIAGNPAIAYRISIPPKLAYVRANDPLGTSWGAPVTVTTTGNPGFFCQLAEVDNAPAITYCSADNNSLHYVRASDALGSTWSGPVKTLLASNGTFTHSSLLVVQGRPAVSYHVNLSSLLFLRANDIKGDSWPANGVVADAFGDGAHSCLAVINGNPAIGYYSGSSAKFVRAEDSNGTAWSPATQVDGPIQFDRIGLVECAGRPAMAFSKLVSSQGELRFIRANDQNGVVWPTTGSLKLDGYNGHSGFSLSLAKIGGIPAICYSGLNADGFRIVRAISPTGSQWATPQQLSYTSDVYGSSTLLEIEGKPAVAFSGRPSDLTFGLLY